MTSGGVGGQVDIGEDRRDQHFPQPLADGVEQISLVIEVAIDLGFGGTRLGGDLLQAHLRTATVDGPEGGVDDLRAHLLTVLTPALAARVDFARTGSRRSYG